MVVVIFPFPLLILVKLFSLPTIFICDFAPGGFCVLCYRSLRGPCHFLQHSLCISRYFKYFYFWNASGYGGFFDDSGDSDGTDPYDLLSFPFPF